VTFWTCISFHSNQSRSLCTFCSIETHEIKSHVGRHVLMLRGLQCRFGFGMAYDPYFTRGNFGAASMYGSVFGLFQRTIENLNG
jgi:hypothetical protein